MSTITMPADAGEAAAKAETTAPTAGTLVPAWGRVTLGAFLFALGAALLYLLAVLWPAVQHATAANTGTRTIAPFGYSYRPDPEQALLLLVLLASALGSYIHAATSFSDYVGNRRLAASWMWWYVLRVFVGSALALLFYFSIRGGFFGANTPTKVINPYGIAAISGLVGLFSKQATDKLRELFDTMFRVAPGYGDDARTDSIANPMPALAGIDPSTATAGGGVLEFSLQGGGFVPASVVRVRRPGDATLLERTATFVGPSELRLTLQEDDVSAAGTLEVTVLNPPPGGGASVPVTLEVAEATQ
jgi:hypothetical protein